MRVRKGVLESQLSARFSPISRQSAKILAISRLTVILNKSQLIFFLTVIFLYFLFKKSQTHTSIKIILSEAFAAT